VRRVFLSFLVFAVVSGAVHPVTASSEVLSAPVDADVADPFREPSNQYGPGNRGIEYDTEPGVAVGAALSGTVVFAGPVAGSTWVTVDHGGGLRTSYGPLAGLRIRAGEFVERGQTLAVTGSALHFSARIDGVYVDPAGLLGELVVEVRLVPHNVDDGQRVAAADSFGERLALLDLEASRGSETGGFVGALFRVVERLNELAEPQSLMESLLHFSELILVLGEDLNPIAMQQRLIEGLLAIVDPPPCTDAATAAAVTSGPHGSSVAERRIAVVIDGWDSSSDSPGSAGLLDLDRHGYDNDDVVRFSYAGGLTDGGGEQWGSGIERTAYTGVDAGAPAAVTAERLAETLRAVRAANPDAVIDVYGHGTGGLIARHAVAAVHDEVDIDVALTFAAPHQGTPLATTIDAAMSTLPGQGGEIGLEEIKPASGLLHPILDDISEAGWARQTQDVAFPDDVHAVTVGHRVDLEFPGTTTNAAGAQHVIVGGFNPLAVDEELLGSEETATEISLALAGLDPACTPMGNRVFDLVAGESIANAYRLGAAGLVAADMIGTLKTFPR